MTHNKFDYDQDLIKPIKYFLKCHSISIYENKKSYMNADDAISNNTSRKEFSKYI